MRFLVVSPWRAWPENWGAAIRLANVVRGLARVGEIDLFVIADEIRGGPGKTAVPSGVPIRRAEIVPTPEPRHTLAGRLWWLTAGSVPRILAGRDYSGVRSTFRAWKSDTYDMAWFYRVASYGALGHTVGAPAVVDIDDLDDYKDAARLALPAARDDEEGRALSQRLRRTGARLQARKDVRLTRAFHARMAAAVDAVVVCSELDRRRVGTPNARVIPNGYAYQSRPAGRLAVGDPPTMLFLALFAYDPNADAAAYLVREILPLVRSQVAGVRLRLVGEPSQGVRALHNPPEITVTGFVPDIRPELERADLIVVPIRYGGGTRIKILEAFAHRIPVVSTTIGAEGIDAAGGQEILFGDTPSLFAEQCVRLLRDEDLRRRIVHAAHRLFVHKYRWDHIQDLVASLASRIAGQRATATAGPSGRPD
jgi:glycosyltransferase involved in cell wall biosynthesis